MPPAPHPTPPATPASPATQTPARRRRRDRLSAFLRTLTPRRIGGTLVMAVTLALLLNPIFLVPFPVLLGRTLFVGLITLLAFAAAGHGRLPLLERWQQQTLAVLVAAPLATLAVYLLSTGGDFLAFIRHEARVTGFFFIAGSSTLTGLLLAIGALVRERETAGEAMALQFALQRAELERQAADARLALLTAQVEPHFLFNTLANVQALVETGSPRAPAVLRSLIAYLKATMPRLDEGDAHLGRELALVRSYLELMHLRMPDRLRYSVEADPALLGEPCPPMLLLTLVENAVRHGIDPSETGGRIDVRAARGTGSLHLSVRDDGIGMVDTPGSGTGLRNLRERLAVFYGGRARLELSEGRPQGLLAEVRIDDPATEPAA